MIEKYIIEHCSPTLASIKTANLFGIEKSKISDIEKEVDRVNSEIGNRGVELIILKEDKNRALIYVCREEKLAKDLSEEEVRNFLRKYGYERFDCKYAIQRLKKRIAESVEFPHEIGLFLGYPLGDVTGFIENAGRNSKCSGCWKVYCNQCQTMKLFERYEKCRSLYRSMWKKGRNLKQLTVAA